MTSPPAPSGPPRLRMAPAPTGDLHVGTARTALYNYLYARRHGGQFILRIEDTDAARATAASVASLIDAFGWLGLDWDEGPEVGGPWGPYVQSERHAVHAAVAGRLEASGRLYRDHRTAEELTAFREERRRQQVPPIVRASDVPPGGAGPYALRLALPDDGEVVVDDRVRGEVRWRWASLSDPVLVRSDGSATYLLANSVDDVAQGVSVVCRGEDLLSATPVQTCLHRLLVADGLLDDALEEVGLPPRDPAWGVPAVFAHLSMIVGPDRQKLSKRHGAVSVQEFARHGYLPEALLNAIALLGWAPGDGRERLDLDDMIAAFAFEQVGRAAAAFDPEKLAAFNGERIRALGEEELARRLVPFLDGTYGEAFVSRPPSDEELGLVRRLVPLVRERMQRLDEVQRYAAFLFREELEPDPDSVEKVLTRDGAGTALAAAAEALASVEPWEASAVEQALRALPERLGMGARKVFQPVRVAVTGSSVSPPLFESIALLPRERVLERIASAARLAGNRG